MRQEGSGWAPFGSPERYGWPRRDRGARPYAARTTSPSARIDHGLRSKRVTSSGAGKRCRVIALARANSRSPSSPWMRPKPESPTPPNGSAPTPAKDEHGVDAGHPGPQPAGDLLAAGRGRTPPRPGRTLVALAFSTASSDVAHPGHGQRRAEGLLPDRGGVLGHVDQHDRVRVRRADRVGAADHRAAAAVQRVGRRAGGSRPAGTAWSPARTRPARSSPGRSAAPASVSAATKSS